MRTFTNVVVAAMLSLATAGIPAGRSTCGYLEWFPYRGDMTMGLNHQMASLSCALGEAFYLQRTLLLPRRICLFALHEQRWKQTKKSVEGRTLAESLNCVPADTLFDVERLNLLVPVEVRGNSTRREALRRGAALVGQGWSSERVKQAHACGAEGPALVRRRVDSEFWFQKCTRRQTDYSTLAGALNQLVGAPPTAPKPVNILLRSGLFFAPSIKQAASAIRAQMGGTYASVHVRRSDKLTACDPSDCKKRDEATRPDAIERALRLWLPMNAHVYVGSTEPPSFFEPLRRSFRLHFAEDFGPLLTNITNNYALYAVETLVFFGSQMSAETFNYQSAWFIDACFPAASLRTPKRERSSIKAWHDGLSGIVASAAAAGAVELHCRDQSGVLLNGVLYGPACVANLPCGKGTALVPPPKGCLQPPLSERLMLMNRTARAAAGGRSRCASLVFGESRHGGGNGGGGGGVGGKAGRGSGGSGARLEAKLAKAAGYNKAAAAEERVAELQAELQMKEEALKEARAKLAAAMAARQDAGGTAEA